VSKIVHNVCELACTFRLPKFDQSSFPNSVTQNGSVLFETEQLEYTLVSKRGSTTEPRRGLFYISRLDIAAPLRQVVSSNSTKLERFKGALRTN